jgi:large subunit ribosomal protein L31
LKGIAGHCSCSGGRLTNRMLEYCPPSPKPSPPKERAFNAPSVERIFAIRLIECVGIKNSVQMRPPAPLYCQKFPLVIARFPDILNALFMKTDIHPKYVDAEIRCACGNVIKTRSTRSTIIVGICNVCHPFYTGQQKFVDTAGRVDKFQQRLAKTQAAQAEHALKKKKKV